MRTPSASGLLALAALPALVSTARADDWPRFRGPGGAGVARGSDLPKRWSATENVRWSVPIEGRAWSSPIVCRGRVFLTTALSEGKDHEPKKGLYFGGNRPEPLPDVHRFKVLCLDAASGAVEWEALVGARKPAQGIHIKNTYASETPVTDGERVFVYFGELGVFAYDLEGEKLWEKSYPPLPMRFGWGTAASPVVHGERLFIVRDSEEQSFVLAIDARTGDELWRVERDEGSNWSTPFVWETPARTELVTAGSDAVRSYDIDGKLLWSLRGMSSITIATPYAADGILYVSSGYVGDPSRPIWAIRPGADGDISLEGGARSSERVAWMLPVEAPYNPTTLIYEGILYTLLDRGFLAAYDAKTGETVYGKQRLGRGEAFTSSPWAYGGSVFCLSEDGDTYVIRAGREFEVERVNPLDEMCMATPAVAGGALFIRTISKLYRIDGGKKAGE